MTVEGLDYTITYASTSIPPTWHILLAIGLRPLTLTNRLYTSTNSNSSNSNNSSNTPFSRPYYKRRGRKAIL
ncbi:hypothetical protein P8C59_007780 [Phyllachora maydis]|uniref:Uncharacterized protein n=1 Tax=Phyllachora maydis TaxID=1825666 RepID=A0AAD9I9Q6_9PEZI|nr:hypothetical protein P8C59_007780 [Phyllachora maydis]